MLTIPALPISWIESYTFLSYFMGAAVSIATLGMALIFAYLGAKIHNNETVEGDIKVFDTFQVFGNLGVAMFVFEGNAVVINIRAETKN